MSDEEEAPGHRELRRICLRQRKEGVLVKAHTAQ